MKLKRFLLVALVLLLLTALLPATVSAAGAKFPSLEISTAQLRNYDTPYTEQFTTAKEPHLIKFTVAKRGIVSFAFDIGDRVSGTPWNLNFDLYTQEEFPYPFWESETRAGFPVEGTQTLSFGLAPGTYYAVMYYDYRTNDYCQSGETFSVTYGLSFSASDQCETENKAVTITPGSVYTGFCGNGDNDKWNFTIPATYVAQIYIANMDSIWEGNDPDIEIFYLHHKEDSRVYYLNPKDAYTDADGDKYFLCQFVPGNYTLEIQDQSRKQTPYAVAVIPGVYITKQPASTKVSMGKTAKVSVQAIGDGLTYKWYHKNVGASKFSLAKSMTGKSYSCTMSASVDGRQVYCVITDKYGNSVKTETVTLSLKFGITKQPANTTVLKNKTAKVSVSAEGDGLKYQWYYKDRTAKKFKASSTKTSTYSVKMTSSKNGRQVYCVITDKYGNSVKTKTVTLKMAPKLKITKQPTTTVKAAANKKVSVTVKATGDGLKYQWYYKNKGSSSYKKYTAGTTASYSTTMSASATGRKVYCVVTDKYGQTVKSKVTTFYANTTVTKQPASVRVAKGQKAAVSVGAVGEKLTYKWYYKDPGAKKFKKASTTKNTYSCTMSAAVNGRQVYCVVKGKYGGSVKTKTVTLSMGTPVSITKQPTSQIALSGTVAKATVAAKGDGLTYKWYAKNKGDSKFSHVSSVSGATYSVKMSSTVSGRQVYCIIVDKYGNKVQTKTVTLSLPSAKQYCGKNIFWQIDKNGTMTMTGSGAMYDYEKSEDRPYDNLIHSVKKIVVGKGITDIGTNAFYYFDEVTSVTLPNTLKTIGIAAFSQCYNIKSITIPDSVTELKQWAFQSCSGFTSFTIPAGVQEIGPLVFYDCGYLESFIVSPDNNYFSTDSYGVLFNKAKTVLHYMPAQLRGRYLMPNTVTQILNGTIVDARFLKTIIYRGTREQWKQYGLGSYTGVTVYYAVTSGTCGPKVKWDLNAKGVLTISGTGPMDEYLDSNTTWRNFPEAITSVVIKPSVTSIANNAFSDSDFLTSVSIPATVKTIGHEAFFHCPKLKSVVIPSGVTILKRYTFGGCSSLTSVYIPASVKTIDVGAFSSCAKLKTVNYGGSSASWKKISITANFNEALTKATKKYNVSQPA